MTLHFLADDMPPRLGLAVSRKVDTRAVVRNRIKRRLREYFRRQRESLAKGAYVVVARSRAANASAGELNEAFANALRRAGALPARAPDGTMPAASQTSASTKSDSVSSPSASAISGDATNASAP